MIPSLFFPVFCDQCVLFTLIFPVCESVVDVWVAERAKRERVRVE